MLCTDGGNAGQNAHHVLSNYGDDCTYKSVSYTHLIKQIGAYAAAMNGLDAVVFTAGLGENQPHHRYAICRGLRYLGLKIDAERNEEMVGGKEEMCIRDRHFIVL